MNSLHEKIKENAQVFYNLKKDFVILKFCKIIVMYQASNLLKAYSANIQIYH